MSSYLDEYLYTYFYIRDQILGIWGKSFVPVGASSSLYVLIVLTNMAALTHQSEKNIDVSGDVEKCTGTSSIDVIPVEGSTEELSKPTLWSRLYDNGVEFHGGANSR
jgi:hypothetical protein